MTLKQKLYTHIFWRNILADLGNRSPYSAKAKNFNAYFQYRVGPYHPDYYLYFPKQPYLQLYKNEIFNKMYEYAGYDIIRYLEFHYTAYEDKKDFIRFLHYEVSERLKRHSSDTYKLKLQCTIDWIVEKHAEHEKVEYQSLENGIREVIRQELEKQQVNQPIDLDRIVQALSGKTVTYIENLVSETENNLDAITRSFSGNITLNNRAHLDKVVKLFILLQTVKGPGKKSEQLFKNFYATDLAAILRQFEEFKDKKINTIQVRIAQFNETLRPADPRVQKLTQALVDFFYWN